MIIDIMQIDGTEKEAGHVSSFRLVLWSRRYSIRIWLWCSCFHIFLACLCCAVPGQEKSAAENSSSGTIEGIITYRANAQRPWRLGRYYIRNAKTGELAEAVVAISKRGLSVPDAARQPITITVDQKDFQFSPETVAIRTGDRIRFLNSDNHPHNVKTTHPDHSFNVTMPVGSEHVETFNSASGILQPFLIDCVFHSAMRAWVFVFQHPWYDVTGTDGTFRLANIPPGDYRLDVVHPAGELRARQSVRIIAGETLKVDVRLEPRIAKP